MENNYNILVDDNDNKILRLSRMLGNKKYALPYFISS